MRVKEKSEKIGLKLNSQKAKTGLITLWQIEGGRVEAMTNFLFLISKITEMVTTAMKLEDTCFLEGKL